MEIILTDKFRSGGNAGQIFKTLVLLIPLFVLCLALILLGYIYGYRSFQKIWVITIVSWSSIILVEPALNYIIFKEAPSGRTLWAALLVVCAIFLVVF